MIELWNSLGSSLQMLVKGFIFLVFCRLIALCVKRFYPVSHYQVSKMGITGVLLLSALNFLPALWKYEVASVSQEQIIFQSVETVLTNSVPNSSAQTSNSILLRSDPQSNIVKVMSLIWLAGVLFFLIRWFFAWRQIRSIFSRGKVVSSALEKVFSQCREQFNISQDVTLLASSQCQTPFIFGILKTRIVLPLECEEWDHETQKTIFLHELAHLRGRDTQFLILTNIVKILHWPNPLIWLSVHTWKESAEYQADDLVIQSGTAAIQYAETLCLFASNKAPRHLPLGLTMAVHPTKMEQRIERLFLKNTKPASPIMKIMITTTLVVSTFLVGGLSCTSEERNIPRDESQSNEAQVDPLTEKLNSIIIPTIKLENVYLEEAIDYLRLRSVELDKTTDVPEKKGINFVIKNVSGDEPSPEEKTIQSLYLTNVPISVALQYICDSVKYQYSVEEFAVVIHRVAE